MCDDKQYIDQGTSQGELPRTTPPWALLPQAMPPQAQLPQGELLQAKPV